MLFFSLPGYLVGAGGFEPPKSATTDLQSAPFGHSGTLPYIVPAAFAAGHSVGAVELVNGFEPSTC